MNFPSSQNQHLGYALHAPRRPSEPGYAGLDIWLTDKPSGQHFDPVQAAFSIVDANDIHIVCIEHPWSGENHLQVVAGVIDLIDLKGRHIEGFCFGGSLDLERLDEETKLELRSPAPVMVNLGSQPIRLAHAVSILIEEFAILMAQRQAYWEKEPGRFDQRLAAADPLKLYAAFLSAARSRLRGLPPMDDEAQTAAMHILRHEIDAITELIPGFELGLNDLL